MESKSPICFRDTLIAHYLPFQENLALLVLSKSDLTESGFEKDRICKKFGAC